MKKFLLFTIVFLLMFSTNSITAFANHIDGLDSTVDISSQENRQEIYEYAAEVIKQDENAEIEYENVEFNNAFKCYVAYDFLEIDIMNEDVIRELISDASCSYEIPVSFNGGTRKILLNESEEELGKWNIVGIYWKEHKVDYISVLKNSLKENHIEDANVYILGRGGVNIEIAAAVCEPNKPVKFLILEGENIESQDITFDNPSSTLYSYDELKEMAVFLEYEEGTVGSGGAGYIENNNTQYALIAGGAVLGLGAAALIIRLAVKKRAKA